jgi:DNA-binding MarR family transcriptional regulator
MRRSDPALLGMDPRLLMALSYLADHEGAHQQELVDALCMDAKNVVLLLNELEHTGYLIRRRDSEDRRRHRVHITTAGREALERAARIQQDIQDDVLKALNAEERLTLWKLLARAVHGAEHVASDAYTPTLTSGRSVTESRLTPQIQVTASPQMNASLPPSTRTRNGGAVGETDDR